MRALPRRSSSPGGRWRSIRPTPRPRPWSAGAGGCSGLRGGERYPPPTSPRPAVWPDRRSKPSAMTPKRFDKPPGRCLSWPARRRWRRRLSIAPWRSTRTRPTPGWPEYKPRWSRYSAVRVFRPVSIGHQAGSPHRPGDRQGWRPSSISRHRCPCEGDSRGVGHRAKFSQQWRPSKAARAAGCHFNFAQPMTFQSCVTRRRAEGTGRAESPNTGSARLHPRTTSRGSDRYASRDPSALQRPRPLSNRIQG